ncbi:MAG: xanthine dehydrogenase family protein subunit M [Anaerolineae bacterium]|nr:MAG: xanthine dehydrogenase family protein subunit M [Anaerolineae bacterium]
MREFDFLAPRSVDEAIAFMSEREGEVHILAGGTDLLLGMREGTIAPRAVMSLKKLEQFRVIDHSKDSGLRLGAMVTLRQIARSPQIRSHYPSLAEAALLMASEQVRSLATVGGNLCNAAPSADMAPPLIALDAVVRLIGSDGERRLPLEEFFLGPGSTALGSGELLAEIEVPPTKRTTRYMRLTPRAHMDIAVVGVAAGIQLDDSSVRAARIVLGAVAPVPLRVRPAEAALIGKPFAQAAIEAASTIAAQECSPISDVRGSDWYRRRMVGVLVTRALRSLSESVLAAA